MIEAMVDFPTPLGRDDAEHLPVLEVDVDPGQHLKAAEGLAHPSDRQQRFLIPHAYLVVVICPQREAVFSAPGRIQVSPSPGRKAT